MWTSTYTSQGKLGVTMSILCRPSSSPLFLKSSISLCKNVLEVIFSHDKLGATWFVFLGLRLHLPFP